MAVEILNPESTILQQVDGQWQKLLTLVVWKLAKEGVTITHADMVQFAESKRYLLTHGHHDSIEFKLVTQAEAKQLVALDRCKEGLPI